MFYNNNNYNTISYHKSWLFNQGLGGTRGLLVAGTPGLGAGLIGGWWLALSRGF